MNSPIRYRFPDPSGEPAGAGLSAEKHAIDQLQDSASADSELDSMAETEAPFSDDDTMLGMGD